MKSLFQKDEVIQVPARLLGTQKLNLPIKSLYATQKRLQTNLQNIKTRVVSNAATSKYMLHCLTQNIDKPNIPDDVAVKQDSTFYNTKNTCRAGQMSNKKSILNVYSTLLDKLMTSNKQTLNRNKNNQIFNWT